MKRILSVQDVSCVGKCSQTAALPIISAMGVETVILPTAVLSTHTAFKNFTFRDLTDDIPSISRVWQREGLSFDAIYTGYLGSIRQTELVAELFRGFSPKLIFVDPAMGDNGRLYTGFDRDYAMATREICARADVIAPNLTEACALLEEDYPGDNYTRRDIEDILRRLCAMGAGTAMVTGVSLDPGRLGVMGYDSREGKFFSCFRARVERSFHGTGDVFAAACAGALTLGMPMERAVRLGVDFTVKSIELTLRDPDAGWYGVNFEQAIPLLLRRTARFRQDKETNHAD